MIRFERIQIEDFYDEMRLLLLFFYLFMCVKFTYFLFSVWSKNKSTPKQTKLKRTLLNGTDITICVDFIYLYSCDTTSAYNFCFYAYHMFFILLFVLVLI